MDSGDDFVEEKKIYVIMDENQKNIPGTNFLEEPTFDLYSPRTSTLVIGDVKIFDKDEKVVYVSNKKTYENIYDFVFTCRINKGAKTPLFAMGDFKTIEEINKVARECYILVSGDKLPEDINIEEKKLIQRYMMYGLAQLVLFEKRNLKEEKIINKNSEAILESTGKHPFGKEDSWALDVSNLFMGMLIDYYNISTNIHKENSQRSFIMNADYRKFLYTYLLEIFIKFIQTNTGKNYYTSNINMNLISREVVGILTEYTK